MLSKFSIFPLLTDIVVLIGCLPFVGEFMQMAYGNCVKHADQKTFDAWGREFESIVTGKGINFFRARLVSFHKN